MDSSYFKSLNSFLFIKSLKEMYWSIFTSKLFENVLFNTFSLLFFKLTSKFEFVYSFSVFLIKISFISFICIKNLSHFPKAKQLFNNNNFLSNFSSFSALSSIKDMESLFSSILIFNIFSSSSFSSSDNIVSQSQSPYRQIFL